MNKSKALAWFEELERDGDEAAETVKDFYDKKHVRYREAAGLFSRREAALNAVFPPGHSVLQQWNRIQIKPGEIVNTHAFETADAVFTTACELLRSDRFDSLMDGVRAETVGELLDQAEVLLGNGWHAAAMVTAGGAVESTLRRLCANASISIKGHGSIEKYNNAIGEMRSQGTEVLTVSQTKMVTTFGDARNRAAHFPIEFAGEQTKESVKNMIDAIRMFVGNVTS